MNASVVRVDASTETLSSADVVQNVIKQADKEPGRKLDLDEAWASLHFMLSGEVPIPKQEALKRGLSWNDHSFENVIMGGETTPYHASFGPARYLAPNLVKQLSQKLSDLSTETFLERYDAGTMNSEQIPPGGWDERPETREWLSSYLSKLKGFYQSASNSSDGLLIYMI